MAKLLAIRTSMKIGSERGSASAYALDIFLKKYQEAHPDDEIINLDLNDLPMAQKTLNSHNFKNFFNAEDTDKYVEQLKNVDKIVLSTPMTNFNYPAVLKNYLDHILVARKTFIYKYDGLGTSEGLLKHLTVQLITTQGAHLGWYPFGNHTEMLRGTWDFVGAKVAKPIIIPGTNAPENIKRPGQEVAEDHRQKLEAAAIAF